jgi:signal peptidase I
VIRTRVIGATICGIILLLAIGACGDEAGEEYEIPSEAMEPTFDVGETVEVDTDAYESDAPEVGDVVTFHPPVGADTDRCGVKRSPSEPCPEPTPAQSDALLFIQRVVAGPGDELSIREGQPVVNGEVAREDFITPCGTGGACDLPQEITIPPDHYFLLGDNRGVSQDSRFWGPVPADAIVGKVNTD